MTYRDITSKGVESGVCIVMASVATATGSQHIVGVGNRIRHVLNWIAFLNVFALLLFVIFNMEQISSDVPAFIEELWEAAWEWDSSSPLTIIPKLLWLFNIPWPIVQWIIWKDWYFIPWNFDPDEHDRDYE